MLTTAGSKVTEQLPMAVGHCATMTTQSLASHHVVTAICRFAFYLTLTVFFLVLFVVAVLLGVGVGEREGKIKVQLKQNILCCKVLSCLDLLPLFYLFFIDNLKMR